MPTGNPTVATWVQGVLDGSVPQGALARLAVARSAADHERWPARSQSEAATRGDPYWFDEDAAQYPLEFYGLCTHIEGELEGQPFDPFAWQQWADYESYGWRRTDTGYRRFNERFFEVPRGNGKSYWMSANGDFMTVADGEPGAKNYALATKEDQALQVWQIAARILERSGDLAGEAVVYDSFNNHRIVFDGTSEFKPLPSNPKKADSLNPHAIYMDEVHEWERRALYTKLKTAMGKRRQPMLTGITTAGDDRTDTIYHELREHAISVLQGWQSGAFTDEAFFCVIFAADDGDDPMAELTMHKANPSLGLPGASVRLDHLKGMSARAASNPEVMRDYLRLHLGRRITFHDKPIPTELWDPCCATEANGGLIDWEQFTGRHCYAGLDMSSSRDLTALTLYFPPVEGWPFHTYRFFAWLPKDNLREATERDRAPYQTWADQGWLSLTDGDEVDDEAVFLRALDVAARYTVVQWTYDQWHAVSIKNRMAAAIGIEMVKFVQDLPSFGEPTKLFLDEVRGAKLRHDGNPLARWCASNLVTKEDAHGNKKPHKKLSRWRIDPIVSAIMARGRAIVVPIPTNRGSHYETEDLAVL